MMRTVKIIATFDQLKYFYGSDAQLLVGAEMVVVTSGKDWVRGIVEGIKVYLEEGEYE